MEVVIYHNPKCSKSRKTLDLIHSRNVEPKVVEYLQNPPSRSELEAILRTLDFGPRNLIRTGESEFKENGLDDPSITDDQLITAMLEHPILIQRPIVVAGRRATVGRPPENVLEIL